MYRLDRGKDCALLAFCQVNQQDGVVVTTPGQDGESGASPSELHQQVMDNFRRCVVQIHEDFSKSANTKVKTPFVLYGWWVWLGWGRMVVEFVCPCLV